MTIEEKLDRVLSNQEILSRNQLEIYRKLVEIDSQIYKDSKKEFLRNYLADVAGTITAELGLVDLINSLKGVPVGRG